MKRNSSDSVIKYVIMETKEDEAVYVDFMPQLWIVATNKNVLLKERSCVNFLFPRRLSHQSKDSYTKWLKQAKFIGAVPDQSEKWEIKAGRILKMNLSSIEEALESQKIYSDYFSTTEGESVVQTPAPVPKKTVRKKKSVAPKNVETSESEDDDQGSLQVSDYNSRFTTENAGSHSSFVYSPVAENVENLNFDQLLSLGAFEARNGQLTELKQSIESLLSAGEGLSDLNNESFVTINVPTTNVTAQVQNDNCYVDDQQTIVLDGGDQETNCAQISCCKGHQKVLNKIDYVQKKLSKELSVVRQENTASRQLLLQVLDILGQGKAVTMEDKSDEQVDPVDGELAHLDMSEVDRFNQKFNEIFPIESSEYIFEFNKSMKDDPNFTDQLFKKLSAIKGEDETKTVRKILKVLCGVPCLKDFTWQGTKKMKSFTDLHLIIELITKLLEAKYPNCAAMDVISKVVKQRTKSAKEAWAGLLLSAEGKNDKTVDAADVVAECPDDVTNQKPLPDVSNQHPLPDVTNQQPLTDVSNQQPLPDDVTNKQISE